MDTIMEAVQLVENDQIEKAISMLRNYLKKATDDEKYTIAELYLQWGFLQEAREILEELLDLYPDESDLKISLADIFIEMEEDEPAITLLNEINTEDPAYVQALIQLADLYQAQGLFEVSEQKLLTAKQLSKDEIIIDFALGELYFSIGEYFKAINFYENVKKQQSEVAQISIDDRLGESFAAAGEYEKALIHFKDDENKNADKLFKYGVTAFQADRNDIAINAWEHVLELDEDYNTVYYQLAKAYEAEGMVQEAFQTAIKGLERDEFNKELYFIAGTVAHHLNQDEESEKFVREAIALDPDFKEAVLFLIELFKKNEDSEAITDLIKEIKKTGADDPMYDWELARAFIEIELYDDALKHYKEAYNSLNQDSDFLKEYGFFLTEEGRITDAIPIFEAYVRLQPLDEETEAYLNRLKQTYELDL
ncbi:tetratricopeptide repeat protein [Oceanobacillus massiliensis]|uniref:tetratricopeptide repeat protein n=1 Tax=Oceanobacillus massiliensis TaxID=1465765 RepID=UPI0002893948|nr:tetratricopeptide repeat protein [Oceanobacillus massiliensis]